MERKKYRLKGHESFILREGWLTKGLRSVSEDSRLFMHNSGTDALGVGTNMAKAIRYWLRTAGLTTESSVKGVCLTDLGLLLNTYDPYMEDIFSLWIMHSNIVRNYEQATSWYLFFNQFDLGSFNKDELNTRMYELILNSTGDEDPSRRSISDDCTALINMYLSERALDEDPEDKRTCPFASLGLIKRNGSRFERKQPDLSKLDSLAVLYLFADQLNKEKSMEIDDLVCAENMPGKVYNLGRVAVNCYLDELEDKGYIRVNRTAGLDIVYPEEKLPDSAAIIKLHFEG